MQYMYNKICYCTRNKIMLQLIALIA